MGEIGLFGATEAMALFGFLTVAALVQGATALCHREVDSGSKTVDNSRARLKLGDARGVGSCIMPSKLAQAE
jgi:hypothetical protein